MGPTLPSASKVVQNIKLVCRSSWRCGSIYIDTPVFFICSLCENFWVLAGQLSDSLKIFVGQKRKMPDKNNRVLLYSNTSLSKFSKHCKFDGNSPNTQEICAIFIHWRPKYCLSIFLDYNFSSDILSGKLTNFAGHFRNLPFLSDRPAVFAKTAPASCDIVLVWQKSLLFFFAWILFILIFRQFKFSLSSSLSLSLSFSMHLIDQNMICIGVRWYIEKSWKCHEGFCIFSHVSAPII